MVCDSLLLVIGLDVTCLPYQVMSSTEITLAPGLLEETEAHGKTHNQRDNQPFLPLDLRSSEESQQGREREDLTPNSPLLVLQMEIEEHQNPLQGRIAACIKDEGDALKAEKKPAREEKQRNREKSGKVAWISAREQRQSPGQISKRHGIPERKVVTDATIQVCIQQWGKKSRVGKGGARTIC